MHSPAGPTHQRLFRFLHVVLRQYFFEGKGLGEVLSGPFAMELSVERKVEPDVMFVSKRTLTNLTEDRLVGPADFAIEIASPSTAGYDRGEKRACYGVGGVREYWMIDPQVKLVIVDRPAGREVGQFTSGKVESQLLPGFWLRAEWLWQDPPPAVAECLAEIMAPPAE